MPINEASSRKPFYSKRDLEELRLISPSRAPEKDSTMTPVSNSFEGPKEFDLNNPPKVDYTHQPYPALVYGERGHIKQVANAEEHELAHQQGFEDRPHPDFDYSQINNGRAARKPVVADEDEVSDQPEVSARAPRSAREGRAARKPVEDAKAE